MKPSGARVNQQRHSVGPERAGIPSSVAPECRAVPGGGAFLAVLFAAALTLALCLPASAQITRVGSPNQNVPPAVQNGAPGTANPAQPSPAVPANPTANLPRGGDLILGPGDVLDIEIADEPELSGKYLVSRAGDISIPTLPQPLHANNRSTSQVSNEISKALVDAQILKRPIVSVFVEEYHSHTVTVVGAVQKPGLYPVETDMNILQAISEAGGLLASSGDTVTVTHASSAAAASLGAGGLKMVSEAKTPPTPPELTVSVRDLIAGKNGAANIVIRPGDIISVSGAPVVYIVGAVNRPGAFAVTANNAQLSVLQALALVEGLNPVAKPSHAIIVRNSTSAEDRKEIPVDISKMMKGKTPDQYLLANDILFVPSSKLKATFHQMGTVAVGAAQEVAGYGSALRVAAY